MDGFENFGSGFAIIMLAFMVPLVLLLVVGYTFGILSQMRRSDKPWRRTIAIVVGVLLSLAGVCLIPFGPMGFCLGVLCIIGGAELCFLWSKGPG